MSTSFPAADFTTFGELLRYLRRRARMTQRDLGLAVGYSDAHITRLEVGSRLPDLVAVKGVFVDALDLKSEPELVARLVELAALAHVKPHAKMVLPVQDGTTYRRPVPTTNANNLPAQLTHFIGREREKADVMRLLETTRLLTLIGAGGVGKTRLALQAASIALDHYADGTWLVELASVTDAELVVDTVVGIFGLHATALALPAKDVLIEHLRHKHTLLVLDNCEHLIQACAELVSMLLRACPRLSILATSREPLNVQGETAWRVPSMAIDEAVQLFEARALTAIPESALTVQDSGVITQICERLDGIPLAIELAASRLRVYSLDMIAARLDDRFRLLTGGERTALPRHQTLHALIEWSYSLLSSDEQRLLRYLSVFAGGWTLEAAESVGESMDVLSVLPRLVDKSLLTVGERFGQRRYTMLETIRQFAAEKLNELGETDRAHERMAAYLDAFGRTLRKGTLGSWPKRQVEMDNVRSLIAWSRSQPDTTLGLSIVINSVLNFTYDFWDNSDEAHVWLSEALTRGLDAPTELRLIAFGTLLGLLHFSGYSLARWASQAEAYLAQAEQIGDNALTMRSEILTWCGFAAWNRQDYDRVATIYERNLELALSLPLGSGQDIANSHCMLGVVQMKNGNRESATAHFRHCLQVGRETDNGFATGLGVDGFAWMDPPTALQICEEEIAWLRAQHREESLARVLQAYTQPLIIAKRYSQAEAVLSECLTYWQKVGLRWFSSMGSAQALLDLGQVAWLQEDLLMSRTWYEQSLDAYSQVGDKERVARLHIYIGLTHLAQGDLDKAAKDFQIGLNLYRELEQPAGIVLALAAYARLAEVRGRMDIAAQLFGAASLPQELLAISIMWPASPVLYQREIALARERFARTPWMHHWLEGERIDHEQAIALALQEHM